MSYATAGSSNSGGAATFKHRKMPLSEPYWKKSAISVANSGIKAQITAGCVTGVLKTKVDRVVVIGGAAGVIGRAVATDLGSSGCRLMLNYARPCKEAEEVREQIEKLGGKVLIATGDVRNKEFAESMMKTAAAEWGNVDVLVNNTGSILDDVIGFDPTGFDLCTKAAAGIMLKKKMGRIINIAPIVDTVGNDWQGNYSDAYATVFDATKTFAEEYANRKITVNAVGTGFIASDITAKFGAEIWEEILVDIPLGRCGLPEEVAGLVKFLALDPSAAYVTGQVINIDGGISIKTH